MVVKSAWLHLRLDEGLRQSIFQRAKEEGQPASEVARTALQVGLQVLPESPDPQPETVEAEHPDNA